MNCTRILASAVVAIAAAVSTAAEARPTFQQVSGTPSRSGVPSEPVRILTSLGRSDVSVMPYEHNGSIMSIIPELGLIVYDRPRQGLSVKRGTVLFQGEPWSTDNADRVTIRGKAYVYRRGCEAAPYDVRGVYHHMHGIGAMIFEGAAPRRAKDSCNIVGHDSSSSNARLEFNAAWY